ncbi:MAG: peptidoglycan-binding protein [Longimicrobiaceae bacterium]
MPKPGTLEKAVLTEMWPGSNKELQVQNKDGNPDAAKKVTVQFNPDTLKLAFANQNAGGDQPKGSSVQFVGKGTTKLTLQLWFDAQLELPKGTPDPEGDVRNLTKEVAFFMTPQKVTREGRTGLLPPAVQFQWGTFLFKGTVDSLEESLELFSENGKPLRASLSMTVTKQDLNIEFGEAGKGGTSPEADAAAAASEGAGSPAAGTQPLAMARDGDTVQATAARAGVSDWKKVAIANGIENPRLLSPGKLLDVSGTVSVSAAASLGLSGSTAPGGRAGAGAAAGFGGAARIGAGASAPASLSASASLRAR